nr:PREDICTED: uncharacterized protein LOC107397445 [Tribolium castaneum]|eukprot:XP_015832955.1 PREDICTED: uncharacterized protein LOC107397445 [Tribolium castaneum]
MCATVFAIPTDDDTDFIFPIALMEEFIPEWKNFLLWCYRLAVFCFIVILTGPFFIVVYVIHNIRFQVLMFLHYLNNLNSGYTQRTINDKKYQNVIKKRLQFCIKRHVHITSIINNNRKELYDFIVIFAVTGVLVLISVLIFVFSFQGSFESQNIRVAVFTLACMLTFLHVIAVGQWIENVILASIFCIEHISHVILSTVEEFEFWDYADSKPEIRNWIKWEALYINTFMVVDAFVAYLSGIFHAIPLDEDYEIFYPLPIFQEFFPDWTNFRL